MASLVLTLRWNLWCWVTFHLYEIILSSHISQKHMCVCVRMYTYIYMWVWHFKKDTSISANKRLEGLLCVRYCSLFWTYSEGHKVNSSCHQVISIFMMKGWFMALVWGRGELLWLKGVGKPSLSSWYLNKYLKNEIQSVVWRFWRRAF